MNSTIDEVELWRKAITLELGTLTEKGIWEEVGTIKVKVSRIKSHGSISERILPKIKRNENGHPSKFKTRVVAGGNF